MVFRNQFEADQKGMKEHTARMGDPCGNVIKLSASSLFAKQRGWSIRQVAEMTGPKDSFRGESTLEAALTPMHWRCRLTFGLLKIVLINIVIIENGGSGGC